MKTAARTARRAAIRSARRRDPPRRPSRLGAERGNAVARKRGDDGEGESPSLFLFGWARLPILCDDRHGRSWGRAAPLRVGSPAHPRNSPEQISGDPEAERNARARCSGYPKTLRPLRFAWGPPCATRRSLTTATARLQSLAAPSAPSFRSSSNQTHLPLGWRGCVGLWARLNATVQCLLGHGPVV